MSRDSAHKVFRFLHRVGSWKAVDHRFDASADSMPLMRALAKLLSDRQAREHQLKLSNRAGERLHGYRNDACGSNGAVEHTWHSVLLVGDFERASLARRDWHL